MLRGTDHRGPCCHRLQPGVSDLLSCLQPTSPHPSPPCPPTFLPTPPLLSSLQLSFPPVAPSCWAVSCASSSALCAVSAHSCSPRWLVSLGLSLTTYLPALFCAGWPCHFCLLPFSVSLYPGLLPFHKCLQRSLSSHSAGLIHHVLTQCSLGEPPEHCTPALSLHTRNRKSHVAGTKGAAGQAQQEMKVRANS